MNSVLYVLDASVNKYQVPSDAAEGPVLDEGVLPDSRVHDDPVDPAATTPAVAHADCSKLSVPMTVGAGGGEAAAAVDDLQLEARAEERADVAAHRAAEHVVCACPTLVTPS